MVVVVMTGRNGRGMMRLTGPGGNGAEAIHAEGGGVVWCEEGNAGGSLRTQRLVSSGCQLSGN